MPVTKEARHDLLTAWMEGANPGGRFFTVVRTNKGRGPDFWYHHTLKAAHRRLGSVIAGKLKNATGRSFGIVTRGGFDVKAWEDSRTLLDKF